MRKHPVTLYIRKYGDGITTLPGLKRRKGLRVSNLARVLDDTTGTKDLKFEFIGNITWLHVFVFSDTLYIGQVAPFVKSAHICQTELLRRSILPEE